MRMTLPVSPEKSEKNEKKKEEQAPQETKMKPGVVRPTNTKPAQKLA